MGGCLKIIIDQPKRLRFGPRHSRRPSAIQLDIDKCIYDLKSTLTSHLFRGFLTIVVECCMVSNLEDFNPTSTKRHHSNMHRADL